jgi:hypothetical protein
MRKRRVNCYFNASRFTVYPLPQQLGILQTLKYAQSQQLGPYFGMITSAKDLLGVASWAGHGTTGQ